MVSAASAEIPGLEGFAHSPAWLSVVHYRRAGSGFRGEIEDRAFYLSPNGLTDPKAEIIEFANRVAAEAESPDDQNAKAACRFPARHRVLSDRFPDVFAPVACADYDRWRKEAAPDTVTFIYVAQFMQNPASIFGHGFLRLENRAHRGVLGLSLSYFAESTKGDSAFDYVTKGLFGGYKGRFDLTPYYVQVRNYGSIENRDIWEYRLNFNADERELMTAHIWELLHAGQTPYYFFNRNCAYQIVRVLEAARPGLDLTESGGSFFATPQDATRSLVTGGGVADVRYRPSLQKEAYENLLALDRDASGEFRRVLLGEIAPEQIKMPATSEALLAYLTFDQVHCDGCNDHLLAKVSEVRARQGPTPILQATAPERPDEGHGYSQFALGREIAESSQGATLFSFRPAAHGWLDKTAGYVPFSQVKFVETRVRIDDVTHDVSLDELDLIDLISISPFGRPFSSTQVDQPLSWRGRIGYFRDEHSLCPNCHAALVEAAGGLSFPLFAQSARGYVFAGAFIDKTGERDFGTGPWTSLGAIADLTRMQKLSFEFRTDALLARFQEPFSTAELRYAYHLSKRTQIPVSIVHRFNWTNRDESRTTAMMAVAVSY